MKTAPVILLLLAVSALLVSATATKNPAQFQQVDGSIQDSTSQGVIQRRELSVEPAIEQLGKAWHSLNVAQLLSRATHCSANLEVAAQSVLHAKDALEAGLTDEAIRQMKQSTMLPSICQGQVTSEASAHIVMAVKWVAGAYNALVAPPGFEGFGERQAEAVVASEAPSTARVTRGTSSSSSGSSSGNGGSRKSSSSSSSGSKKSSGSDSSSSGGGSSSTTRKKGGHKKYNTTTGGSSSGGSSSSRGSSSSKNGGDSSSSSSSSSPKGKSGSSSSSSKGKSGSSSSSSSQSRNSTRSSSSRGKPRSGGSSRGGGGSSKQGWLGHNDLPQNIMQWLPYGNPIDDCWMGPNWAASPKQLADCVEGYATGTTGGKAGRIYHVTSADDNRINPAPGTFRYGATRKEPLWIVFDGDYAFTQLDAEIIVYGDKTIDARGRNIVMGSGPCLAIEFVSNVIVHGISFKNCKDRTGSTTIMTGPDNRIEGRNYLNGYGIYVYNSHHVWIDHCSFDYADDTLVDVVAASTMVTISNSIFKNQDKVILMGHDDSYSADRNMRVTVMLNKFGPNVVERMPRGRYGKFHVLNNYYPNGWGMYCIGGSADPTFLSEGNFFVADSKPYNKDVAKHDIAAGKGTYMGWDWQSVGDFFQNGAFFTESGSPGYKPPYSYKVLNALEVPRATNRAGPIGV
eukprot:TRINITY_DN3313_c0_g2_i1.p1 TRINITY_DN3313_c0_g2~~TRINITY_DN3313_c0_g2_i1.p1  ORF type:complete len:681 (+),score=19.17 TRINITY_DN3313_c0_g2_i1:185-2227(+)